MQVFTAALNDIERYLFTEILPLHKILQFHLISWCENFVETHSVRRVSGELPKTLSKLCVPQNPVFHALCIWWSHRGSLYQHCLEIMHNYQQVQRDLEGSNTVKLAICSISRRFPGDWNGLFKVSDFLY